MTANSFAVVALCVVAVIVFVLFAMSVFDWWGRRG